MGHVAEPMANRMANPEVAIPLSMARTDGRTNGRPTHLIESSSVPERAGENREIRILTVRQPWAWAIIHGGKDVENRVRNVAGAYRGPVAIHVSMHEDVNAFSDLNSPTLPALDAAADRWLGSLTPKQAQRGYITPWHRDFGRIIGVVDLVGVHHAGDSKFDGEGTRFHVLCSPWAEQDVWHLQLANPRPLSEPIPYRGALGLRRLPDDVADAVRKAVAS